VDVMRVMTLGQIAGGVGTATLPSSESTLAAIRGEPGSWAKVLFTTTLRALIIAPGVWVGGGRGWRLVGGSLVGSVGITAFLFFWHLATETGREEVTGGEPVTAATPAPGPMMLPEETATVTVDGLGQVLRRRRVR
jgi:hypothetical protein